jgi:hypothetical protein
VQCFGTLCNTVLSCACLRQHTQRRLVSLRHIRVKSNGTSQRRQSTTYAYGVICPAKNKVQSCPAVANNTVSIMGQALLLALHTQATLRVAFVAVNCMGNSICMLQGVHLG